MCKFTSHKLVIFFSIAILSMNGICQSPSTGQSNKTGDPVLVNTDKLKIELHIAAAALSPKAFVVYSNDSKSTLWFPIEPTPAYRPDEKSHLLKIWFGYFAEVNGLHKGQYMLPKMHSVQPGENFKFELTSPLIVQELLKTRMKTKVQVRVATKAFADSRVRNNQPFEDYINNSIIIESTISDSK